MRPRFHSAPWCFAVVAALCVLEVQAQEKEIKKITCAVSYVTSTTIYVDAGTKRGVATGDTLHVTRKGIEKGEVLVLAVSSSSASASILAKADSIVVGDSVWVVKEVAPEAPPVERPQAFRQPGTFSRANAVTGSVALQYVGAGAPGSRFDYSQPAAVVRLNVGGLFGTGAILTVNGRAYRDLSGIYDFYGGGSRTKLRMYELSLTYDDDRAWYGYSFGRVTSRYVSGMGQFDGGQFLVRSDNLSLGLVLGTQPDYRSSGFVTDEQKTAAFVHYTFGPDVFNMTDFTLAYGQQLYQGRLDRDFVYLQSSSRLGSELSFYQSSEIDLHKISDGVRSHAFRVSSTFATLTYTPLNWLSTNIGYDATRNIYLFQSMKSLPDSLLDQNLQQGYRGMVSVQVLRGFSLMVQGNYRAKEGGLPSAKTIGEGLRLSDIMETGVTAGGRYASIEGIYTKGNDFQADVNRWFSNAFSLGFRFDRYAYSVLTTSERLVTTTASVDINSSFAGSLYSLLSFDKVWDTVRNSVRIYYEFGMHF